MVYTGTQSRRTGIGFATIILGVLLTFLFILFTVKYGWDNTVALGKSLAQQAARAARLAWHLVWSKIQAFLPA